MDFGFVPRGLGSRGRADRPESRAAFKSLGQLPVPVLFHKKLWSLFPPPRTPHKAPLCRSGSLLVHKFHKIWSIIRKIFLQVFKLNLKVNITVKLWERLLISCNAAVILEFHCSVYQFDAPTVVTSYISLTQRPKFSFRGSNWDFWLQNKDWMSAQNTAWIRYMTSEV